MGNDVYVVMARERENLAIPLISAHDSIESAMMWMMKFTNNLTLVSCNGCTTKFDGYGARYEITRCNIQDISDFYGCPNDES